MGTVKYKWRHGMDGPMFDSEEECRASHANAVPQQADEPPTETELESMAVELDKAKEDEAVEIDKHETQDQPTALAPNPDEPLAPNPDERRDLPRILELQSKILACENAMTAKGIELTRIIVEQGAFLAEMRQHLGHGLWERWCNSPDNPTRVGVDACNNRIKLSHAAACRPSLLALMPTKAMEAAGIRSEPKPKPKEAPALPLPPPSQTPLTDILETIKDKEIIDELKKVKLALAP